MNIDERIEALTMNLELASRDIQDLREQTQKLDAHMATLTGHMATLTGHMSTLATTMTEFARVAKNHEQRLSDLEDGTPRQ